MQDMQAFQWTGMNKQGMRVRGVIDAPDLKSAEMTLKTNGIEIISIRQKPATKNSFFGLEKRIKTKDIILFTRYLSTMLNAGMPILASLEIISRDQENSTMKSMVTSLKTNISTGMSFSDALAQFPKYFNQLYVSLTRAGEKSATLDKVLNHLIKYLDKIERLKSKVKTALIYPVTIVVIAMVVSLILLIFVVPQFQKMFESSGVKLPMFTRMVIGFSEGLRHYWLIIFASIFLLIYSIKIMRKRSEHFSDWFDHQILKLYIIGPVLQKAIIARFSRTLAITLDAGLPIVESMKSMVNIMGNKLYSKAISKVCEDLVNGNQLGASLESTRLFPGMVVQMISVGEASGALGEMLNNIANYYEEEVDYVANNLSTILEPLILVVLGVIMGCFIIAMYMPIFKMGTTI